MTFLRQFQHAVDDYLAHLTVERALSDNTIAAYRRDLTHYRDHLNMRGVLALDAITPEDCASFVDYLRGGSGAKPLATTSVARMVTAMRRFHEFLLTEGLTTNDPSRDIHPPKIGMRLPKAISIPQMQLLIQTAANGHGPIALRDLALVEILYGTGARISEAIGLKPTDIDSESASIRLLGKGRKERVLPLGRYALEAVDAYLVRGRPELAARSAKPSSALFLNKRGNGLSRQSAWGLFKALLTRHNLMIFLPYVSPFICHPPPPRWGRCTYSSRNARTFFGHDNPDLYHGDA